MGRPSSSCMTSSVYQFAPFSGSEALIVRTPSGKPRSVHSVCPPGPTMAISFTGVVSKAARRIATTSLC